MTPPKNNQHFLVVSALGNDSLGVLEAFTKISKLSGCNILTSKSTLLGEEAVILLYLSGSWHAIAKMEASLPALAKEHRFDIQTKRTLTCPLANSMPYQIQVTAHDKPGILHELAQFFRHEGINIDQMDAETYQVKTRALLTSITLLISIPLRRSVSRLRERFLVYCDERNLDAAIEPFKPA